LVVGCGQPYEAGGAQEGFTVVRRVEDRIPQGVVGVPGLVDDTAQVADTLPALHEPEPLFAGSLIGVGFAV
jgi:hypothetical protein